MAAVELSQTRLATDANLVSYWKLESNYTDEKGNNTLTAQGSGNSFVSAKFNNGLSVNGSGYASVTSSGMPTGNTSFTAHVWAKFNSATPAGLNMPISWGNVGSASNQTYIYENTDGKIHASAGGSAELVSTTTVSAGVFYALDLTWDGTNARLYVNGSQEASSTPGSRSGVAGAVGLGAGVYGTPAFFMSGVVDDAAVFNRALTSDEVNGLANGFPLDTAKFFAFF